MYGEKRYSGKCGICASVVGLIIAGEVVKDLCANKNKIAGAPAGRISKPGICCQNLQQMPGFFCFIFFHRFPENLIRSVSEIRKQR